MVSHLQQTFTNRKVPLGNFQLLLSAGLLELSKHNNIVMYRLYIIVPQTIIRTMKEMELDIDLTEIKDS